VKPKSFMLIAGEASGDLLAAELVSALRSQLPTAGSQLPVFFGAGGPKMAEIGVELMFDLTRHAATGIPSLGRFVQGRKQLHQLFALAVDHKPDAVIGVDYGFFNLRFGHAIRHFARDNPFSKWNPKIVQFVSPQVWASRPRRAKLLEADYDLLLSIFPFEKEWYAQRAPKLRVEFVGHPMVERFASEQRVPRVPDFGRSETRGLHPSEILLLPGSRKGELKRHLPVMLDAVQLIQAKLPESRARMVLPNPALKELADKLSTPPPNVEIQAGNLPQALARADVVISKTGTVTMECAFFGVPTVTLYQKPLLHLAITLGIITVKSLTMPNLLAGAEIYPEFLQKDARPENIAQAALELLENESRRQEIRSQLAGIIASLGGPGACDRAARAILSLFD
jgi:lipid-A-disaccharide synthase